MLLTYQDVNFATLHQFASDAKTVIILIQTLQNVTSALITYKVVYIVSTTLNVPNVKLVIICILITLANFANLYYKDVFIVTLKHFAFNAELDFIWTQWTIHVINAHNQDVMYAYKQIRTVAYLAITSFT